MSEYLPRMAEWIKRRHLWEYTLALQLYELDSPDVKWPTTTELTEKFLIDTDPTTKEFIVTNNMLLAMLDREEEEVRETPDTQSPSPSIGFTLPNTSKKGPTKRRRKTNETASLHDDLQKIIIPKFTPVNDETPATEARDEP